MDCRDVYGYRGHAVLVFHYATNQQCIGPTYESIDQTLVKNVV